MTLDINFDEYEVCETWTCSNDPEVKVKGPEGQGWILAQVTALASPWAGAFGEGQSHRSSVGCLYLWKRKRESQAYR